MNARQARDVERWAAEDAARKNGWTCQLCGGVAVVLEPFETPEVLVWDLCETCNAAFHFLAVGLELLQAGQ